MKTIGEYYKEKVLCLPKDSLQYVEVPYFSRPLRIEKDLFGWKIHYTKLGRKSERFIECRSEEEARYLKVFLESGITRIRVPKDDEYLKSILPELEKLKARIDEIINSSLRSVLDRSKKAQLRHEIFAELMKEAWEYELNDVGNLDE